MKAKTLALAGAAALAGGPALAAAPDTAPVPVASSYAELLAPIPDAAQRLKLADAAEGRLILAQYAPPPPAYQAHHHHHHHHVVVRRRPGWYWNGYRWVRIRHYRRHHHHHHQNDSGA